MRDSDLFDEGGMCVVIPVTHDNRELVIILLGIHRWVDNEGCPETINVLAL